MSGNRPKLLWGLRPSLLGRLWFGSETAFERLKYDPDDSAIKPGRLLRRPVYAPMLNGVEPYSDLVEDLRKIVRHPSAILEFGYDWRLPVQHNADLLAKAIDQHLTQWRRLSDRPDAKVHLVAHSMGGLLCWALASIAGGDGRRWSHHYVGNRVRGGRQGSGVAGSGFPSPDPSNRNVYP